MVPNNQPVDSTLSDSESKKKFDVSKQEINDLLEIHMKMDEADGREPSATGRRPRQVQVLHRAAIIMITACWQAYLEDLFREASNKLLSHENAYQDILKSYVDEKLHYFHNPLSDKVNRLFKCLGLENLSRHWTWKAMSHNNAMEKLDKYVSIRHEIAHGGESNDSKPDKSVVKDYLNHVERLVEKTEEAVKNHVEQTNQVGC